MNPRLGYDVFISHSREDKVWARELAQRIARVELHGRALRPWLDEEFLDPGVLAQKAELTTALDRSRMLLLILSPASVASPWVNLELGHFLSARRPDEVIVLAKAPCELPGLLEHMRPLDCTEPAGLENAFGELVARLCPRTGPGVAEVDAMIERAWTAALRDDPGGLDAVPSAERDALATDLLHFRIEDPVTEGLALAGFTRAAQLLQDIVDFDHRAAYNMKMCLAECLAVAIHQEPHYRQVAQRYLELERPEAEDPVLAFVVTRAYSKLAEISPTLIDLGTLLRIATQLDANGPLNNNEEAVAILLGRVAAKLRGTDPGDLLIQTLSRGGAAARIAAIAGIAMCERLARPVYYLSELAAIEAGCATRATRVSAPPSRKLQALLFGIDRDQPQCVQHQLDSARNDLRRSFSIEDLPYGHIWLNLREAPPPVHLQRAPFLGTVVNATTTNMAQLSLQINASNIVCLTEPRVVDALFGAAGGLLIPVQDENSPQCQRLMGRNVSFAMLEPERMGHLKEGDHVEIDRDKMRIVAAA